MIVRNSQAEAFPSPPSLSISFPVPRPPLFSPSLLTMACWWFRSEVSAGLLSGMLLYSFHPPTWSCSYPICDSIVLFLSLPFPVTHWPSFTYAFSVPPSLPPSIPSPFPLSQLPFPLPLPLSLPRDILHYFHPWPLILCVSSPFLPFSFSLTSPLWSFR